jgi:predicted dehydrogenase
VLIGAWPIIRAGPVAAHARKHVLTGARMAATAEDARSMLRAARNHPDRVAMIVPATFSALADAIVLLGDGAIGRSVTFSQLGSSGPGDPTRSALQGHDGRT